MAKKQKFSKKLEREIITHSFRGRIIALFGTVILCILILFLVNKIFLILGIFDKFVGSSKIPQITTLSLGLSGFIPVLLVFIAFANRWEYLPFKAYWFIKKPNRSEINNHTPKN